MTRFLLALQFLTIIPLSVRGEITDKMLGESLVYFPLVGILLGGILVGSHFVLALFLPENIVCVFLLLILILLTGALHVDGFADTLDGLFSRKSREEMLQIMRDSRLGTMAVLGLIILLLLKYQLLYALSGKGMNAALLLMPLLGRWGMAASASLAKYARSNGGVGKPYTEYAGLREFIIATVLTFLGVVLIGGIRGILVFISVAILAGILFHFISKKLGGMTGDTYGALGEIVEVAVLLGYEIFS
jgi:adenosylcobinamide-GDP ribazoletransferase